MEFSSTTLALVRAIGFKTDDLIGRHLQEAGASSFQVFRLYRFALVPSIIWSLIFISFDDLQFIAQTPELLLFVVIGPILWNVQVYIGIFTLNKTSSMSGLNAFQTLITLPLLMFVGAVFNHDSVSLFSFLAIALIVIAMFIQPKHHSNNKRTRFALPVASLAGFILLRAVIESANFGVDRTMLRAVGPEVYLGVFCTITLSLCWLWTARIPNKHTDTVVKDNYRLALLIPTVWFAATIPEMYALESLPIYTVAAIGTVAFAMDTGSDLVHKRIRLDGQTILFTLLVVGGIVLAVIDKI